MQDLNYPFKIRQETTFYNRFPLWLIATGANL